MVEKGDFDKYLIERYNRQVKWYDEKSILNKKLADIFQISIIFLAAITPVLAALELKWPTIVSSSLIAAVSGIFRYCKFDELWHNYRTICETLRKEKNFYDFKMNDYEDANNPEKVFIERVEHFISQENTEWFSIVKKQKIEMT
ncbi:Uncharacterised protein [uncultured archaeon]|nr:Uncharacterised protein [uncultured archaeon]